MTERPSDSGVDHDAEEQHHALITLHDLAGALGDVDLETDERFRPRSPGEALQVIATAPEEDVPLSARLAVLHDLARADFPGFEAHEAEYRQVVESITGPYRLQPDGLLADLKESARARTPFSATATGQQLPHHVAAFVGEDICHIRSVNVGGLNATWIFSEFETNAPFEQVVGWIDPRSWPERGPLLFKGMDIVDAGQPVPISELGTAHWHAVFHERVQIIAHLDTLLHCDYWRDGQQAAGMTYDLNLSLDGAIDVDRGFLSVNDLGQVRRVKALKIVGFTNDTWDRVAATVCPTWTDWVRSAVEGGTTSTPKPVPPGEGTSPAREIFDAWVEFFGDSARAYFDIFADATSRAASGNYRPPDWVADGTRYWSRLARDWAQAWTYGMDLLEEVAKEGLNASFMPPGAPAEAGRGVAAAVASGAPPAGPEGTVIPVIGLAEGVQPLCSDLRSIEAAGATIPSSEMAVRTERLDEQTVGVRLGTTNTSVPAGLYVGELRAPDGRTLTPVQLYVSRAAGGGRV